MLQKVSHRNVFLHVLNTVEDSDKVWWNKNFQSKCDQGLSFFPWRFPNSEDMFKKCPVGICLLCVSDMSELPDKLWRDKIFKNFVQVFAPLHLGKSGEWPKTIFDQFQHLPMQNQMKIIYQTLMRLFKLMSCYVMQKKSWVNCIGF